MNNDRVKTWDVYFDGKWAGQVQAKTEQEARNAGISTYNPKPDAEVSVNER